MKPAFFLATLSCLVVPVLHASPPEAMPPEVRAPAPGARVFVFHGTGYVFSPGLKNLCADLRHAGLNTEELPSFDDHWVCRRLIAEHRAGRLSGPIILVGHSRGARHALYASQELEKAGIAVDLVVCVDVAGAPPVPGNVGQAMNLYLTQRRLYPAAALHSAPKSATAIDNVDLNATGSPVDARGLYHVNITDSPGVQDVIYKRILQVARGNR